MECFNCNYYPRIRKPVCTGVITSLDYSTGSGDAILLPTSLLYPHSSTLMPLYFISSYRSSCWNLCMRNGSHSSVLRSDEEIHPNSVFLKPAERGRDGLSQVQIIAMAASFPGCWVSRQPRRRSSHYVGTVLYFVLTPYCILRPQKKANHGMVAVRETIPPIIWPGTILVSGSKAVSSFERRLALFRSSETAYYLFRAWFRNHGQRTDSGQGEGIPWTMQWPATVLWTPALAR